MSWSAVTVALDRLSDGIVEGSKRHILLRGGLVVSFVGLF